MVKFSKLVSMFGLVGTVDVSFCKLVSAKL